MNGIKTPLSASNLNLMQSTLLGNVKDDLTDDTKIPSVKAINDKILKTKNINLTVNTDYVYSTDWDYACIKIGNVVFLSINIIAFKVGNIPNHGVLLSNLPKPSTDHVFLLAPKHANLEQFRVAILQNGQLVRHWTADPEYGNTAENQYNGSIIYFTND